MKKRERKKYQVRDYKCYDRECFIPFSGNGRKICRLYEMGQCPEKYNNSLERTGERWKRIFDSIICLTAEGPEYHTKLELMEIIQKEAVHGYELCKRYLTNQSSGQEKVCPKCGETEPVYCCERCGHRWPAEGKI